jgi:hypothetical protein
MEFYIDLGTLGIVVVLAVFFTLTLKAGRLAIWCIKTVVGSRVGHRNTKMLRRQCEYDSALAEPSEN